ncbi:MAG TPA: hypothetical protein VGC79_07065 [Polyangiaceae bacterium]
MSTLTIKILSLVQVAEASAELGAGTEGCGRWAEKIAAVLAYARRLP